MKFDLLREKVLPLAAAVDVALPFRLRALLLAAVTSTLLESSSLVSSRDSSSSLVDGFVFVVDAFIGVAFFFEPVVVSAFPLDSSSSSIGR